MSRRNNTIPVMGRRVYPRHKKETDLQTTDLGEDYVVAGSKGATLHCALEPGRNEPCRCGSGKKYKKCHGAPGQRTASRPVKPQAVKSLPDPNASHDDPNRTICANHQEEGE